MKLSITQLPKEEKVKVEKVALNLNLWPRKTKTEVITTVMQSNNEIGKY